jgi:hypothetical protein
MDASIETLVAFHNHITLTADAPFDFNESRGAFFPAGDHCRQLPHQQLKGLRRV